MAIRPDFLEIELQNESFKLPENYTGNWTPVRLVLDSRFSAIEKDLISVIYSLSKLRKGCYASNEYLSNFICSSISHTAGIISKLRQLRIIEDISFDGRKRKI